MTVNFEFELFKILLIFLKFFNNRLQCFFFKAILFAFDIFGMIIPKLFNLFNQVLSYSICISHKQILTRFSITLLSWSNTLWSCHYIKIWLGAINMVVWFMPCWWFLVQKLITLHRYLILRVSMMKWLLVMNHFKFLFLWTCCFWTFIRLWSFLCFVFIIFRKRSSFKKSSEPAVTRWGFLFLGLILFLYFFTYGIII